MGLQEFWDRVLKRGEKAEPDVENAGNAKRREYKFEKILGSGTYGEVRLAVHLPTGQKYAVKVVKKSFLVAHKKIGMIKRETFVLGLLQHPNIIRMHEAFETADKYYIIFELATGGELFDRIVDRGKFTERDAAVVMATIINAVVYLHEQPNEIIHRDLKPENLIFLNKSMDSPLVIVDFGIAKVMQNPQDLLTTVCGSPGYTAPEVLRRVPYGKEVDIYSCGVICYTLLCGYGPFAESKDITEMCDRIVLGRYGFDSPWWDPVGPLARDFVTRLMELNPAKRLSARQCLHHEWLTEHCPAGYIAHLRKINEHVLKQEFRTMGMEMPADIRTMPRRLSTRPDLHPLKSLAALPAIPKPDGQHLDPMQMQQLQLQAQLAQQQQQLVLAQQRLAAEQALAQQIAQAADATIASQQVLVPPVFPDPTQPVPEIVAPADDDDDYDPYEFLINLEDDNLSETHPENETFKRGILQISDEAGAAESEANLLDSGTIHTAHKSSTESLRRKWGETVKMQGIMLGLQVSGDDDMAISDVDEMETAPGGV